MPRNGDEKMKLKAMFTKHARERFSERFPGMDFAQTFEGAGRVGRKVRANISKRCKSHEPASVDRANGVFYRFNKKADAVFVCKEPEIVLTVFSYRRHLQK